MRTSFQASRRLGRLFWVQASGCLTSFTVGLTLAWRPKVGDPLGQLNSLYIYLGPFAVTLSMQRGALIEVLYYLLDFEASPVVQLVVLRVWPRLKPLQGARALRWRNACTQAQYDKAWKESIE